MSYATKARFQVNRKNFEIIKNRREQVNFQFQCSIFFPQKNVNLIGFDLVPANKHFHLDPGQQILIRYQISRIEQEAGLCDATIRAIS